MLSRCTAGVYVGSEDLCITRTGAAVLTPYTKVELVFDAAGRAWNGPSLIEIRLDDGYTSMKSTPKLPSQGQV